MNFGENYFWDNKSMHDKHELIYCMKVINEWVHCNVSDDLLYVYGVAILNTLEHHEAFMEEDEFLTYYQQLSLAISLLEDSNNAQKNEDVALCVMYIMFILKNDNINHLGMRIANKICPNNAEKDIFK